MRVVQAQVPGFFPRRLESLRPFLNLLGYRWKEISTETPAKHQCIIVVYKGATHEVKLSALAGKYGVTADALFEMLPR